MGQGAQGPQGSVIEAPPGMPPLHGWVLYDGLCGFCSRWVPHWQNVLRRHGFHIEMLQAEWVNQNLKLPEDELALDIRLLLRNGGQRKGADVYRYVMQRIWWAWPLYALASLPGLRQVFDGAYRRFADNRYWISRTCHMPAKVGETPPH